MITKGVVSFEDGVKASEEYAPPRKVRVELHFDIDPTLSADGVQATIDTIADQAKNKVYELLGTKPPKAGKRAEAKTDAPVIDTAAKDAAKVAHAEAEAKKAAKAAGKAKTEPAPVADALNMEEAAEEVEEDFSVVEAEEETAEPVSDAELNTATQKRNAEIKNPTAIRTLIGSYNPDKSKQFNLNQIPQAKRHEFLAKLKELQPAG